MTTPANTPAPSDTPRTDAARLPINSHVFSSDVVYASFARDLERENAALVAENAKMTALLNTPELHDFSKAVVLEAAHQRERWPSEQDAGKTPADWFWLVGYLAGKALHSQASGNVEKALHHTISTAAALANWHAAISGTHAAMRPGIDPKSHPEGDA